MNADEHGYDGPIHTQSVSSTGRDYPLRDQLKAAWASAGAPYTTDANSGHPQGVGELIENRNDGARQLASTAYPLNGVKVMTETLVHRIQLERKGDSQRAMGIELENGQILTASKELIVSAGAYLTPKVLMLSGIGSAGELTKLGITAAIDAPEVGKNLIDHMAVAQWWKLRNPQVGLALGSPGFNKPAYGKGTPMDWMVTESVPYEGLKKALSTDDSTTDDSHPLLASKRSSTESLVVYVGANATNPTIPMDGSHITSTVVGLLPTSRGTVTLQSNDPTASPHIDPNYYATEADRYVMRHALKRIMEVLLDTKEGKAMVESETFREGRTKLSSTSSDAELDEQIREYGK